MGGKVDRERILERLGKLKALADFGVAGERENAKALLERIAGRYGIDLDELQSEEETDYMVEFKKGWRLKLIAQIVAMERVEQYGDKNADHCWLFSKKRGGKLVYYFVRCTAAEWTEIRAKFDILARDYEKQLEVFFTAFLSANELLVPAGKDDPDPSDDQIARALQAARMSQGIVRSKLNKQIEAGSGGVRMEQGVLEGVE